MAGLSRTRGRSGGVWRRWGAATVVVLASAVVATSCSGSSGSSNSSGSSDRASGSAFAGAVTIAVQGPMSGPQAATGKDMLRGAKLAATDINARGGVERMRVEVTAADDAADPGRGRAVARRVAKRDVVGVVGPFNSSVGVKSLPVYRQAGIPIARLTSAATTEGFGITTQPMQGQIAEVEAPALMDLLHASSVAVLYDPSTFTAAVARQLRQELETRQVAVPVFRAVSTEGTGRDQVAAITAALEAVTPARPTVTYLAMYGPQAGQTVALMEGNVAYGRCFVDLAAQGPDFTVGAGARASTCLASGVPAADELPRGAEYTARYEQTFDTPPGTWGPFAYDSVQALARAARRAGSWDHAPVRKELARTDDRDGMTGHVRVVRPSGNRVDPPIVVLRISADGTYRVDPDWAALAHYP
jgi:branched-chain amino acid transport system substrate-binding protein